jgi:LuxR family transcriptional regulator, maltose regulon positive regulatory protein
MASVLLQTKLYRPTLRPDLVSRARLREHLSTGIWSAGPDSGGPESGGPESGRAFARKLTLIAAPAGFGKTTVMADFVAWLQACDAQLPSTVHKLASSWLSLDAADNDPARFLRYLIGALQNALPDVGQALPLLLESGGAPPLDTLMEALINEIAARPQPVVLALDDYHVIHNAEIERLMSFLLDHQPPNLHLIIASRSDPALPLSRLRARGQLLELRIHALRFTESEAAAFLTETMGLALRPDWITALEARTEGWIAGLQLAALSLQGHSDWGAFIEAFSGSHRYIIDYLVDEVLRHQPPELRDFLVHTSILERLCGSLCDAMMGDDIQTSGPSTATLQTLESANLFLIPLDDRREWYRYHHLFADSLRAQLNLTQQAALHRRAALWFEAHNMPLEAVHHARVTGDLEFTADVIERAVQRPAAWSGGQLTTLVQWLDVLPDAVLTARPALSLHASRTLFLTGRMSESERLLDRAIAALQGRQDEEAHALMALANVYRGSITVLHGQMRLGTAQIKEGLAQLPESALHARARGLDMLALACIMAGDVRQAEAYLLETSPLAQAAGVDFLAINAYCEAAQMQVLQGRLDDAEATYRRALALSDSAIPPHGLAWAGLGEIARERNDLTSAEDHLTTGMALAQQGGLSDDMQMTLVSLAWLKQHQGDPAGARHAMDQATRIAQAYQVEALAARIEEQQARLALAQARVDDAKQWADRYQQRRNEVGAEYSHEVGDLILTRVYLVLGQANNALEVLARVLPAARAAGRQRAVIESLLLQARALLARGQGEASKALKALGEAVTLAAPERWLRLFIDESAALAPLLVQVRYVAPPFVDEVLEASQVPVDVGPVAGPAPLLASGETLNARELEILGLLADGLTNREIGQALYIGVGTVKWYLNHLYDKLDVGNRTQAVARARECGLL